MINKLLITAGLAVLIGGTVFSLEGKPTIDFTSGKDKVVLNQTTFEKGVTPSKEVLIPDTATMIKIVASRGALPVMSGEVIQVNLDLFDGTEWISDFIGFGTTGGDYRMKDGSISPQSSAQRALPSGKNRKIRIFVNAETALDTQVSVEYK